MFSVTLGTMPTDVPSEHLAATGKSTCLNRFPGEALALRGCPDTRFRLIKAITIANADAVLIRITE